MSNIQKSNDGTMPLISVIIPVYNAETTLERCLNSVCNQSYESLEIIIVVDGATDDSLSICRRFETQDKRIKIYAIDNHGVSYSRNLALTHATGDYICFVDSDDWIESNMYETMMKCAIKYDADVVIQPAIFQGITVIDPQKFSEENDIVMDGSEATIEMLKAKLFSGQLPNKMIKHSYVTDTFCDENTPLYEDTLALWHVLPKCKKVVYQHQYCYHYIMNQSSAMHQTFNSNHIAAKAVANRILSEAKKTFPEAVPYAQKLSIEIHKTVMHRAYTGRKSELCSFRNEYRDFKNCVNDNFSSTVRKIMGVKEALSIKIESCGMVSFLIFWHLHKFLSHIKRLIRG